MMDLKPLYAKLRPLQSDIDKIHEAMDKVIDHFVFENWGLRRGQKASIHGQTGIIVRFDPMAQFMRCTIQVRENFTSSSIIDNVKPVEEEDGQQPFPS